MSHELEQLNDGNFSMAYAGEVPWHGLGTAVAHDLSPIEMLKAAGLDWTVSKEQAFIEMNDMADQGLYRMPIPAAALVRSTDKKILDVVTPEWNPLQNEEAFEFFADFVAKGKMEMHTAGSLKGGKLVWGLAAVKEGFFVGKRKDEVQSHLLFTNPHQFGKSIDVRFTPIRVVCWNTICMALGSRGLTIDQQVVKANHRKPFDAEKVKAALGIAHNMLEEYKDAANFIASKRYDDQSLDAFLRRIFPKTTIKIGDNTPSRNHILALQALQTMPGNDIDPGSWWQAFNSITYLTDHVLGREPETRLDSAWFGSNRNLKSKALNAAVEMASKAKDLEVA